MWLSALSAGGLFTWGLQLAQGDSARAAATLRREALERSVNEALEELGLGQLLPPSYRDRRRLLRELRARALKLERVQFLRDSVSRVASALREAQLEYEKKLAEHQAVCRELQLSPELASLKARERGARITQTQHASTALRQLEARMKQLDDDIQSKLSGFRAFLEAWGFEGARLAFKAQEAEGLWLTLQEQLRGFLQANQELQHALQDESRAKQTQVDAATQLEEFWTRCGLAPEDEAGLRRLLQARPAALELERSLQRQQGVVEAIKRELAEEPELILRRLLNDSLLSGRPLGAEGGAHKIEEARQALRSLLDRDESLSHPDAQGLLTALISALEEKEAERESQARAIGALEEKLGAAGAASELEEARSARIEAEAGLRETRQQGFQAELSLVLLTHASSEREGGRRPPALDIAADYFSRFTNCRFELLLINAGDSAEFFARDTKSGAQLKLSELSEGTRIHLLLAARLGYLEASEAQGMHLPLCLDEALATTDPERFLEIAKALLIASERRQLFYFSTRATEHGLWRRAAEALSLPPPALLQTERLVQPDRWDETDEGGARQGAVDSFFVDSPAAVPAPPPSRDPRAWASELRLPRPTAFSPPGDWHLLHLLPSELDALHSLLKLGISHVGPFLSWSQARAEARQYGEVEALGGIRGPSLQFEQELHFRAELLKRTLLRWREERGEELRWSALAKSGVLSQSVLVELEPWFTQSWRGDPEELVDHCAEIKGVGSKAKKKLGQFLRDSGVVRDRPARSLDSLRAELLGSQSLAASGSVTMEEAARLVDHLLALIAY